MKNNTKNRITCPEMDKISTTSSAALHSKSEQMCCFSCREELGNSSKKVFFTGKRGFPTKCVCGSDVTIYTSGSKTNPGRPYFRCAVSREDGHLFKWFEDGMYEEVKDLIQQFGRREAAIDNGTTIAVNELLLEIVSVKEDVSQCKTELRCIKIKNMVVLVMCFCVLALVIMYHIMFNKVDQNTLVFGNK